MIIECFQILVPSSVFQSPVAPLSPFFASLSSTDQTLILYPGRGIK